ncbi:tyrosine-type recombinase/integrase [Halorubrum sp. AD140]|uniref:tyrosine-type recombinase/integrase n=1 Tax=Halorubrum sp. AD140 TaxID=3050073 RepID=UPI002ACD05A9|nr:tyrosine-type recombinase/integrase [Halorubrum sp. AD140]MDZ5811396.1 tyrosine-type recombinase/integrase [Halorubrum sp. AD140]
MGDDLEPIPPERAVEMHLDRMKEDSAEWTRTTHRSELRPFVECCRQEGAIDNLNELTGRHLYEYRIWRREGGYSKGKVDELAKKTLHSNLSTLRSFLRFCGEIEAVPSDLYEKMPLVKLTRDDEVSDSYLRPERAADIVEYLSRYEYASRDHVVWALIWHTGARLGAVRSLDRQDLELEGNKPSIGFVHRPETGTPLKNDAASERVNRISRRVAQILQDYIDGPRTEVVDDYGRNPLVSTDAGRIAADTIRKAFYRWTRPCFVGKECPHDEDPDSCKFATFRHVSGCPSARSPHDARKARVTKYRNDGVPRGVVSDQLNASEDVLDKHYGRASEREKADRR